MNQYNRDQLLYLKGVGQVPTIESGLTIDNTDGDERLLLPLLSTAECASVLNAEGEVAFDEQTHDLKWYNGTSVISAKDPASLLIASQAAADVLVASSATAWKRLGKGAALQLLKMNAGGTDIEWASGGQSVKIWVPVTNATGTGVTFPTTVYSYYTGATTADAQSNTALMTFPIPSDFATLIKAVVIAIAAGSGDCYRVVNTAFAANGEAYNTHTDTIAAAAIAMTAEQIYEDDISAALTGIAANDYVGLSWARIGGNALDTIGGTVGVIGLLMEYTL